jgi:hypothetical protein
MGAQSATGVGYGAADRLNSTKIEALAIAPTIIFTGFGESIETMPASPPAIGNVVYFPYPLPGSPDKYVVMLTSLNSGAAYIADRLENDNDDFIGFTFYSEAPGQIMYLVAKVGTKPV